MVLNLITFASLLHKQASILGSHELILNELEKYFTVNIVEYQNINKLTKDDFSLLFIATGGVERLVIQHFESLPRPAILLADGMQNSLAAALEISSWLRGRGVKSSTENYPKSSNVSSYSTVTSKLNKHSPDRVSA